MRCEMARNSLEILARLAREKQLERKEDCREWTDDRESTFIRDFLCSTVDYKAP